MNARRAEAIMDALRMMEPHLTTDERRTLISMADRLLSDSINFLSAMDNHSRSLD